MAESANIGKLLQRLTAREELALVVLLVLTAGMMILPMPTIFADVLIAFNIGLSMLFMMVAIHIASPVEFSTLPAVILITTAFRLSLSITTSRMVLVQGDAGEIIGTFGEFVIAGNVVVGLVVYLIITIVQFVVITKGSERVAEVAARFTLDALPGKQISIDTDLKNGDIDPKEARRRRHALEKESQLYGAMDGAMKFVKGDAIASLVIIIVNLIGGITIGCVQRGMPFSAAVHTYSLLAVGDGLIAQIPALLISLTAGVIVTRVTTEGTRNLGQDIFSQLTAEPRTLQISAIVLAVLAFVPGFPVSVFLTLAVVLGVTGWELARRAKKESERTLTAALTADRSSREAVNLEFKYGNAFSESEKAMEEALSSLPLKIGTDLGISVPSLRVTFDAALPPQSWRLYVDGIPSGDGTAANLNELLPQVRQALCRIAGQFIGIQETQRLLAGLEPHYADLIREASKSAPLPRLAEVLRRLLDEQVSISNLRAILEAVAEWAPRENNTAVVAEHIRTALCRQICYALAGPEKILPVILIEASLDEALRGSIHATPAGTNLVLAPAASERLLETLRQFLDGAGATLKVSILASSEIRRHLRVLLSKLGIDVPVLTHGEFAQDFKVNVIGTMRHAAILPGAGETPHLVAVEG